MEVLAFAFYCDCKSYGQFELFELVKGFDKLKIKEKDDLLPAYYNKKNETQTISYFKHSQ